MIPRKVFMNSHLADLIKTCLSHKLCSLHITLFVITFLSLLTSHDVTHPPLGHIEESVKIDHFMHLHENFRMRNALK